MSQNLDKTSLPPSNFFAGTPMSMTKLYYCLSRLLPTPKFVKNLSYYPNFDNFLIILINVQKSRAKLMKGDL